MTTELHTNFRYFYENPKVLFFSYTPLPARDSKEHLIDAADTTDSELDDDVPTNVISVNVPASLTEL